MGTTFHHHASHTCVARCPLCQSTHVSPFLNRVNVPALTNALYSSSDEARQAQKGTIHLALCLTCGFIFNSAFDSRLAVYSPSYDNSQAASLTFQQHMNERVQALVEGHGVRNCRIVEVGCGDGYFLRQLVQAGHNEGIGFDPSYRGALTAEHMTIETRYYDASCAHTPADVLICRHVIEHIPDPVAFLCEIRRALLSAPHARVFFETPCVRWILDKLVWWDVYYEHCNYFSQQSLALAFALAGFHVKSIEHVFEGQYLWLEAVPAKNAPCPLLGQGTGDLLALTQRFGQQELEMRQQWTRGIASLERPIALLGAAGKGVAFMNLLDPDHTAIACVVDLNPQKQGKYLPGTGHPIVDYPTLVCYGIRTAILLNPNYRRETLQLLHTYQLPIRLIG